MSKKIFSIIIVNYQSRVFLNSCLKSIDVFITPILKNELEIIIVNNDFEKLKLNENFYFDLKIIENNENSGFGKAINKGFKIASGKFLFFLNPDTEFKNNSFKEVVNFFQKRNNDNKILGLKILEINKENVRNNNYTLKNKVISKPEILNKIQDDNYSIQEWSCGYKTSLFKIISRNSFVKKPWLNDKITQVDWVSGCAMIVGKELFEKIGGFDDNFFMYFEDQDLCLRAEEIGARIFYFPLGEVFHWGGQSWDGKSGQKMEYFKSQDYFFEKHFGKWQVWVLRFFRWIFK